MRSISKLASIIAAAVMAWQPALAQTPSAPPPARAQAEGHPAEGQTTPFDSPPLPKGPVSLIGGILVKVDPIHDLAIVRVFGGRDLPIDFDGRTKVMRDEVGLSMRDLQPGARIYVDTILVNGRNFAKTIRIEASPAVGEVRGQVTSYDARRGILIIRDERSPKPLRVGITSDTAILHGTKAVQASQLTAGTLVKISFRPGFPGSDAAQRVEILAQPGNTFTFTGKITSVDVRSGHIAIANVADGSTYEVAINQISAPEKLALRQGADVAIRARFDGNGYEAQTIESVPNRLP